MTNNCTNSWICYNLGSPVMLTTVLFSLLDALLAPGCIIAMSRWEPNWVNTMILTGKTILYLNQMMMFTKIQIQIRYSHPRPLRAQAGRQAGRQVGRQPGSQAGSQAGRQPKTLQGPAWQPARHPPDKRNEITMVAPMSGHSQVDLQDPEAGKISRVNCAQAQAHNHSQAVRHISHSQALLCNRAY